MDRLSSRNKAILSGIAEAFREAVSDMCGHTTLEYGWVQYIPDEDLVDPFWRSLRQEIVRKLQGKTMFRLQLNNTLRAPSELRLVPESMCDQHGHPLLEDLQEKPVYLSTKYKADSALLRSFGIKELTLAKFVRRLEADLRRPRSRWKENVIAEDASHQDSATRRKDWYSRVCDLLLKAFNSQSPCWEEVQKLNMIPLDDGEFRSASWIATANIFMPDTKGILIPACLNLVTIHRAAVFEPHQKRLYRALNVQESRPAAVVDSILDILKRQDCAGKASREDFKDSRACLYYLYSYASKSQLEPPFCFPFIDESMNYIDVREHVYCRHGDDYGPGDIFDANIPNVPKYPARFLEPRYLTLAPSKISDTGDAWNIALKDSFGVRWEPQLLDTRGSGISSELKYIKRDRPDVLVGLLWKHWRTYKSKLPKVRKALRTALVPVEGNASEILGSTVLPLPELKGLSERFSLEAFPYLQLPDWAYKKDLDTWKFLAKLDVIVSPSLDFYLILLENIASQYYHEDISLKVQKRIFGLFSDIATLSSDENDKQKVR